MNSLFRCTLVVVLAIGCAGSARTLLAAKTWNGSTDAFLGNAANWTGGLPTHNNNANSDVIFSTAGASGTTLTIDYVALIGAYRNTTFDASAPAYTFVNDGSNPSEYRFNFAGGGTTATTNNSAFAQTFNNGYLGLRRGALRANTADFVLNGAPLNMGDGATVASINGLNLDGTANIYVNQGFVGDGGSRVDKNGTGTVFLAESPVSAFNTGYTPNLRWGGQLSIANGAVEISNGFSLGEPGDAGNGWTEIRSAFQGFSGTDTARLVLTNGATSGEFIYLAGRPTSDPHIVNKSGTNTLSGTLVTENDATNNNTVLQSDGTAVGDKFVVTGSIQQTSSPASNLLLQGAGNGEVSGTIVEAGGVWNVVKNGAGTWTLSGNNTYAGATTVNAGTLLANNTTGSATGTSAVAVNAGGTLGGTGAISGAVTVNSGGTLSPGASIESLATGSVSFGGSSIFKYEINSTLVTADLLNASAGSLSLSAGALLSLADLNPGTLSGGTKFTMISYNGVWNGGIFAGAPNLGLVSIGGNGFRIRYQDLTPGLNFQSEALGSRFVTLTAVPEFSSLLTMGLVGCCAIVAIRLGKRFGLAVFSLE